VHCKSLLDLPATAAFVLASCALGRVTNLFRSNILLSGDETQQEAAGSLACLQREVTLVLSTTAAAAADRGLRGDLDQHRTLRVPNPRLCKTRCCLRGAWVVKPTLMKAQQQLAPYVADVTRS
jgi:hypothetical protein